MEEYDGEKADVWASAFILLSLYLGEYVNPKLTYMRFLKSGSSLAPMWMNYGGVQPTPALN